MKPARERSDSPRPGRCRRPWCGSWSRGGLQRTQGEGERNMAAKRCAARSEWPALVQRTSCDAADSLIVTAGRNVCATWACLVFLVVAEVARAEEPPQYEWTQVTAKAEFTPRDGAGALTYQGKMWFLGGWNPGDKKNFPRICNNEVWSSAD